MFNTSCNTLPVSIPLGVGNGGTFGGNGFDDIIALAIIAMIFGWNGNGNGIFGGGRGTAEGYTLASDFATIQRQLSDGFNSIDNALDRQNAGICDLGYTNLSLHNQTNMSMMQGFNSTQAAIKDCCCQTQQNIADTKYTIATVGNGIQNQIQNCCCDVERQIERGFADTNYNMATQNCATLQAIDKVGDRILERLTQDKLDSLTSENQALRLQASQVAQNQYLVNTLTAQIAPRPVPSFTVNPPYQYTSCGCGCGCN